jgi:hypothetical protein
MRAELKMSSSTIKKLALVPFVQRSIAVRLFASSCFMMLCESTLFGEVEVDDAVSEKRAAEA